MTKLCVEEWSVKELCVKDGRRSGGGGGAEEERHTECKTRTPHKDVGKS